LLIESVFFKLSDYFQSVESPSELYEAQVAFIFAVAIYQELQNRGFPYLLPYIQFEKPYTIRGKWGKKLAVDIYFKILKDKFARQMFQIVFNSNRVYAHSSNIDILTSKNPAENSADRKE